MRVPASAMFAATAWATSIVTQATLSPKDVNSDTSKEDLVRRGPSSQSLMQPLERFVLQLRVFVTESHFYDNAFDMHKARYAQHIEDLRSAVSKVPYPNMEVIKQLEFASSKFGAMAAASAYRKHPQDDDMFSKSLIRDVNDLSIFLLHVQDCHGDPDPNMDRYAEIVKLFRERMRILQRRSEVLTEQEMPSFLGFQMHARLDAVDQAISKMEAAVRDGAKAASRGRYVSEIS